MEKFWIAISAVVTFLVTYFWNISMANVEQFIAVFAVIFFDGFAGILVAVKNRDFRTYRAIKTIKKLFSWWFILTTSLFIEKAFPGTSFISETLIIPFCLFEALSGIKNLSLAGWIDLSFLRNIDKHKTFLDK
jgi:hypothetical protein